MKRKLMAGVVGSLCLAFVSFSAGQSTADTGMPQEVQKQIDDHIIGEWTYEGTWGDKQLKGEERIRWVGRKTAVLTVGHEVMDGKRTNYAYLMGWDGEGKKLVTHGFNEDGEPLRSEWSNFSKHKWTGQGMGTYRGVKWKSPATLEFKENWQRYEDETDGKPWIAVFTRKTKTP